MNLEESEAIKYFKNIDENFDGRVSKEEIIYAFAQVELDIAQEIDSIMNNLDMDQNGYIDYSELKIALVDWDAIIKKKNLIKLFSFVDELISFEAFKIELAGILASEWADFSKKTKVENGMLSVGNLKVYIKANIEG